MINAFGNYIGFGQLEPIQLGGNATIIDIDSNYAYIQITYTSGSTSPLNGSGSFTFPTSKQVEYLVVAGGGGGGFVAGGGGAGGYCTGSLVIPANALVEGRVGQGGLGSIPLQPSDDESGQTGFNSTLYGPFVNQTTASLTTIVAFGGGGGGGLTGNPGETGFDGKNGGSGGGAGLDTSTDAANTGSFVIGQGFQGGASFASFDNTVTAGGGGGGATGAGGNAPNQNTAGNGGQGISSTLTGTTLTYSGGGGAVQQNTLTDTYGLANAIGRGANGGENAADGTGGGGGGSSQIKGSPNFGNGGSGIILVRFNKNQTNLV